MKKIGILVLATFIVGLAFTNVNAQKKTWVVSKDVQKVANKKEYKSTESEESHIKPVSYDYPLVVLSKDVQKVSNPEMQNQVAQGNVVSKGTPDWVVSKGVHRSKKSVTSDKIEAPASQKQEMANARDVK